MSRHAQLATCEHEITGIMYTRGFEYGVCDNIDCFDKAADTIWVYTGRIPQLRLLPSVADQTLPPTRKGSLTKGILIVVGIVVIDWIALLWLLLHVFG